jgi:hypothetical protein
MVDGPSTWVGFNSVIYLTKWVGIHSKCEETVEGKGCEDNIQAVPHSVALSIFWIIESDPFSEHCTNHKAQITLTSALARIS